MHKKRTAHRAATERTALQQSVLRCTPRAALQQEVRRVSTEHTATLITPQCVA
jgi:hypothetical protein